MKKLVKSLLVVMVLLTIPTACSCEKRTKDLTDAERFKEEFESLNDTSYEEVYKLHNLSIPKENPIVYKTDEELVESINNKETFIVFFGYKDCYWCRCMIPSLIDMANDLSIEKIYYVDISNIRNTLEVNEDKTITETEKGTESYEKLLELFGNVLKDYSLVTTDGEAISSETKRIYAPTVISVKDGEAIMATDGISDSLENAFSDITEEQKKEMDDKLKGVMEKIATN